MFMLNRANIYTCICLFGLCLTSLSEHRKQMKFPLLVKLSRLSNISETQFPLQHGNLSPRNLLGIVTF